MGTADEGKLALQRLRLAHADADADLRLAALTYAALQLRADAAVQRAERAEAEVVRLRALVEGGGTC